MGMAGLLHINSYGLCNGLYYNLYREEMKLGILMDVYEFAPHGAQESAIAVPNDLNDMIIRDFNHENWQRSIFSLKHNIVYNSMKRKAEGIGKYGVSHAHSLFSNGYLVYRIKQEYGVPYVVTVRNTDVNDFFRRMFHMRRLGVKLMEEALAVVFLSEAYRATVLEQYVPSIMRDHIMQKCIVIPNGIDDFWFENRMKTPREFHGGALRLLTVGVIDKNKNHITVIKACELLRKKGFFVDYHIIGKALQKEKLKRLLKYNYVHYSQPVSKEQLIQAYREADIFVMPSHMESFGLVYAEAMSQGVPVVYTRGQGFDLQFPDGAIGYAVDDKSPAEVSRAIERIVARYSMMSGNCIEGCLKFNWHDIAVTYAALYKKADFT